MTRVCQYCTLEFGEKCGFCGSLDVHALFQLPDAMDGVDLLGCHRCGTTWIRGSDDQTDGICDACLPGQLAAIKAPGRTPAGGERRA